MAQEIERKFLVKGDFKKDSYSAYRIRQGYLSSNPDRSVRIRQKGDKGYITVKGATNAAGTSRFEWEKEIELQDAENMLALCEPGMIEKTRYLVKVGDHTFEVDEFFGENAGLVIAEVELESETESFEKPEWLGDEVTGNPAYYNSMLCRHPFTKW